MRVCVCVYVYVKLYEIIVLRYWRAQSIISSQNLIKTSNFYNQFLSFNV